MPNSFFAEDEISDMSTGDKPFVKVNAIDAKVLDIGATGVVVNSVHDLVVDNLTVHYTGRRRAADRKSK